MLTQDLAGFMRLCQPVMLLTQAAMALGVADAALGSAGEALRGLGAVLADEHADLVGRRDEAAGRLTALAAGDNPDVGPGGPAEVRLDALQLVAEAVNLDGVLQGGEGFRADSPTSRRRREAAFLPARHRPRSSCVAFLGRRGTRVSDVPADPVSLSLPDPRTVRAAMVAVGGLLGAGLLAVL